MSPRRRRGRQAGRLLGSGRRCNQAASAGHRAGERELAATAGGFYRLAALSARPGDRSTPRQRDVDRRAEAFASALGPQPTAVALDDLATDIQPEPEARDVARECIRSAAERLEDTLGVARGQSDALISNVQLRAGPVHLETD